MCTLVATTHWTRATEDIRVLKILVHNDRNSCRYKREKEKKYMTPYQYRRCDVPGRLVAVRTDSNDSMCWPFFRSDDYDRKMWKVYDGAIHSYSSDRAGFSEAFRLRNWEMFPAVLCLAHIPKGGLYIVGQEGNVISKSLVLDSVVADNRKTDGLKDLQTWYREFCRSEEYRNMGFK